MVCRITKKNSIMEGILENVTKQVYKWVLLKVNGYTKEEIEEIDIESESAYQELLDIIIWGCTYDEV
jgi:hypothetical protein